MPILVTGSQRSGTARIGNMLTTAPEAYYVSETLNPQLDIHNYGMPRLFGGYFTYISRENALSRKIMHYVVAKFMGTHARSKQALICTEIVCIRDWVEDVS